jgi:hypothetical protein
MQRQMLDQNRAKTKSTQELDKQLFKLQIDLAGLEDDYMKISSKNLSVSKEDEAINKTIREVKLAESKIDSKIITVQNENVRVELDTLNAQTANV